ncbi:MAG: hypothetical protein SGI92_11085 [Bryobacteraceae bacterium]|nr:hypothetical protein [Bryobacteraceae bacterium]
MPSDELTYINLKLAALGQPTSGATSDPRFLHIAGPLLRNHYQKDQLLGDRLCPADGRIQSFLDAYLADVCPGGAPRLPSHTFVLDRPGLARELSLPPTGNTFTSPYLNSYRIAQGVLHNPVSDRRTTQGIFHIVEGGLPVPADKIEVPKLAFARLLAEAFKTSDELMRLPFTSDQGAEARLFVSLLLRPLVCPATATDPEKRMETRFFAPGSLVSNLDFVEAIFGNGGDPYLPENDAALDVRHWTGHSGCVILAPHLVGLRKTDLGLPHTDLATERQRRDGMCWHKADEKYNGGNAFKIACRDERGVMVTIIAENYYGYGKKEVKTQISFAANLFGLAEEEHAGGAIAFPSYVIGQEFYSDRTVTLKKTSFEQALELLGDAVEVRPGRYAVDRQYPTVFYVPEDTYFNVREGRLRWQVDGVQQELRLLEGHVYVLPSGYKVSVQKQPGSSSWRLVGSWAGGTLCHKPCTVSGGGKSEISKSIAGVMLRGPVFVRDYHGDMAAADEILRKDYSNAWRRNSDPERAKRPILSSERSLGSVIKLLTPSSEHTDEHNAWLATLPQTVRQLVFTIKRYYQPEWGDNWREWFTVDQINGTQGNELKFGNAKLVGNYLRVGFDPEGSWRIYKLRPDFHPADKVQVEDDITASVVVPRRPFRDILDDTGRASAKLVENCENMLFQRPDDAIIRGADEQAEADIASPGTFLSNFEPLTAEAAGRIVDHIADFDAYTEPMKRLLREFVANPRGRFVVSSAHPRIVDGKPSKNPRYLQKRPDRIQARETYLADVGTRLYREIPAAQPVRYPVNAVLAGRRNNPPDPKNALPALAVYNPIHYQELPELFMEFISSLTGKSPSTTGFGSEGALTKGPFNALPPVVDVNNALLSMILTGNAGFTTAAGHVGPRYRVDHDVSMLVPEIWCRMKPFEREPAYLIENGYLERVSDFVYEGRTVMASRLGYRITPLFAEHFLGRLFETPNTVFTEEMLRPELQDIGVYVEGIENIHSAQKNVALNYFEDGSVEAACPPVQALLHMMAHGHFGGKGIDDPEFRAMFSGDVVLKSDWYQERLRCKQERDTALWERHSAALAHFAKGRTAANLQDLDERIAVAKRELARVKSAAYPQELEGTIGADPFVGMMASAR